MKHCVCLLAYPILRVFLSFPISLSGLPYLPGLLMLETSKLRPCPLSLLSSVCPPSVINLILSCDLKCHLFAVGTKSASVYCPITCSRVFLHLDDQKASQIYTHSTEALTPNCSFNAFSLPLILNRFIPAVTQEKNLQNFFFSTLFLIRRSQVTSKSRPSIPQSSLYLSPPPPLPGWATSYHVSPECSQSPPTWSSFAVL